jgi:hypothetical protein
VYVRLFVYFYKKTGMVTAVQNKNKTTITISRRLSKSELERVVKFLHYRTVKPQKGLKKVQVKEVADEITNGAWSRFAKERGLI